MSDPQTKEVMATGRVKRILLVTPVLPSSMVGGGGVATRSIHSLLQASAPHVNLETLPLRDKSAIEVPHKMRQAAALMRAVVTRYPSKVLFDLPFGTRGRLIEKLSMADYDLVVINGGQLFWLAKYLPKKVHRIGVAHNVEAALVEQQYRVYRALPVLGRFFHHDYERFAAFEQEGLAAVGRVICLSEIDAKALEQTVEGLETLTVPTSFCHEPARRAINRGVQRPLRLGFVGKFSWWPNREAIEWLTREVLLHLPDNSVKVLLFGPGSEQFKNRHPAVETRGFVPDLNIVWEDSDLIICPMRSGSGINIKLVEAIYNGCPIIATPHAARGLPLLDDPAICLCDNAKEWVDMLSGNGAEALARLRPRPETQLLFSQARSVQRVSRFLWDTNSG